MPERGNQIQSLMENIQIDRVDKLKYKYKVGIRPRDLDGPLYELLNPHLHMDELNTHLEAFQLLQIAVQRLHLDHPQNHSRISHRP